MAFDGAPALPRHGGLLDGELGALGLQGDEVLDLSVNVNPYGPCAAVRRALEAAPVDRYPDPTATAARQAFASHVGVETARVVLGHGAAELMWTLARATLRPGDRALLVEPTFSEMRAAAARVGAQIVDYTTTPERDFAIDVGKLDAAIAAAAPRLVYACSPQNPSGRYSPLPSFEDLARRHPETLMVVDRSFLSLSTHHADRPEPRAPRVAWLRSLTKDHTLPGLRVGAAVLPVEVARAVEQERPPWSVNALVQAAIVAMASDDAARFLEESRTKLFGDTEALTASLRSLGLRTHESDTIYVLAYLGDKVTATHLRRRLLERHRILVRDASSFGLPHHIRIAGRSAEHRARLLDALRRELSF